MPTPGPEFTEAELREAIAAAQSWAGTLRNLGYTVSGRNADTVRKYATEWGIDTSHFDPEAARLRGLSRRGQARPLDEILVRGSSFSRGHLKERLYREGLKRRECEICGQDENWRGSKIALILDHINGVGTDNRLENLRIVCPNCAAGLPTHCGRGKRKPRRIETCPGCGQRFTARFKSQMYCSRECGQRAGRTPGRGVARPDTRKVARPPYEQLLAEIEATSFSAVGRKYGISDSAVRKWLRFYERQIERERRERDGQGARPEAGTEGPEAADEAA